jgi:alpha-1,3/alpha-1,6-mannosyltransferase
VAIPSDGELERMKKAWRSYVPEDVAALMGGRPTFLSINRYERKKNIGLAIRALALVHGDERAGTKSPGLVIAGGYDVRLAENVEHLKELQCIVQECGLEDRVVFMTSFSDEQRLALLCGCCAVTYTPTNEHFGIVPIETMAASTPVIACRSGGPMESVVDGETGYLKGPTPRDFADAMRKCLDDVSTLRANARGRVQAHFSRKAFGDALERILFDMQSAGDGLRHE